MRIISILVAIFGGLGMVAQVLMIFDGDMHRAVSGLVLFGGFMVLGLLGNRYKKVGYKGGTPSIIGAFMLFLGILKLVVELEEYGVGQLDGMWWGLLFSALCIVGGFSLVRSGHKAHVLKRQGFITR